MLLYRQLCNISLFLLMGICVPSYAVTNITGYYQEKSNEISHKHNQLCISSNNNGHYHVDLATVYCPSEECMNARLDSIYFDSLFKNNKLKYKAEHCEIIIHISKGRAIVKQKLNGCGNEQQWLFSDGNYELIRKNLKNDDCRH